MSHGRSTLRRSVSLHFLTKMAVVSYDVTAVLKGLSDRWWSQKLVSLLNLMVPHLSATGCYLSYGITQCYLPPNQEHQSNEDYVTSQTILFLVCACIPCKCQLHLFTHFRLGLPTRDVPDVSSSTSRSSIQPALANPAKCGFGQIFDWIWGSCPVC